MGLQPCPAYGTTSVFGEDLNQCFGRKKPQTLGNMVCTLAASRFHLTLGALELLSSRMLTVAGRVQMMCRSADLFLNLNNKAFTEPLRVLCRFIPEITQDYYERLSVLPGPS